MYILSQNNKMQGDICEQLSSDNWLVSGLIKETLRLYPVAPFIGRYAASDGFLGGYPVKKNVNDFV